MAGHLATALLLGEGPSPFLDGDFQKKL